MGKALVFASTKRMCEDLANQLHHSGVSCAAIHGDKDTTFMTRYLKKSAGFLLMLKIEVIFDIFVLALSF